MAFGYHAGNISAVLTCNQAGNFALQLVEQTENLTFRRRRGTIALVRADGSPEITGISNKEQQRRSSSTVARISRI